VGLQVFIFLVLGRWDLCGSPAAPASRHTLRAEINTTEKHGREMVEDLHLLLLHSRLSLVPRTLFSPDTLHPSYKKESRTKKCVHVVKCTRPVASSPVNPLWDGIDLASLLCKILTRLSIGIIYDLQDFKPMRVVIVLNLPSKCYCSKHLEVFF